jgi:hypothetical protein
MKYLKQELTDKEGNDILNNLDYQNHFQKLRDALLMLCDNNVITNVEYIKLCEKVLLKERKGERIYPINPEEGD